MKVAIKLLSVILLASLGYSAADAQEVYTSSGRSVKQAEKAKKQKEKGFDKSKLIFGGALGGGFDDVSVAFSVSPIIGYRISDHFAAGVGFGYQYFRVKDYWSVYNSSTSSYDNFPFKSNFFSASAWGRYIIWRNIFAHVEYEQDFMSFNEYHSEYNLNTNQTDIVSSKTRYSSPAVLIGPGIRQPIGEHVSLVLVALYDVVQDKYSPYLNHIDVRFGFNVGF